MTSPREFMGIPVEVDLRSHLLADSRGIWPFKRIVLGPGWFRLLAGEREAVLAHEAGHCRLFHLEKRILAIPLLFLRPAFAISIAQLHELEADRFAAERGYGVQLLKALAKLSHGGQFYPSLNERETVLKRYLKESDHA